MFVRVIGGFKENSEVEGEFEYGLKVFVDIGVVFDFLIL